MTRIASLFCFSVLMAFATVSAQAAETSNRTVIKRQQVVSNNDLGHNGDDYNFIGIQGSLGLAHASLSSNLNADTSIRLRPMFGVYYERRFIPYLGARAGVDFTMRGFSAKANNGNGTIDYAINYLEFPLLLKAQIPTRIVTPFIAVGPFFGLTVGKTQTENPNRGASQDNPAIDNTVSGFNFGLNFGAGVDFQIVRHLNIEVGARYSLGLTNVLTSEAQQTAQQQLGFTANDPNAPSVTARLSEMQFITGLSFSI